MHFFVHRLNIFPYFSETAYIFLYTEKTKLQAQKLTILKLPIKEAYNSIYCSK